MNPPSPLVSGKTNIPICDTAPWVSADRLKILAGDKEPNFTAVRDGKEAHPDACFDVDAWKQDGADSKLFRATKYFLPGCPGNHTTGTGYRVLDLPYRDGSTTRISRVSVDQARSMLAQYAPAITAGDVCASGGMLVVAGEKVATVATALSAKFHSLANEISGTIQQYSGILQSPKFLDKAQLAGWKAFTDEPLSYEEARYITIMLKTLGIENPADYFRPMAEAGNAAEADFDIRGLDKEQDPYGGRRHWAWRPEAMPDAAKSGLLQKVVGLRTLTGDGISAEMRTAYESRANYARIELIAATIRPFATNGGEQIFDHAQLPKVLEKLGIVDPSGYVDNLTGLDDKVPVVPLDQLTKDYIITSPLAKEVIAYVYTITKGEIAFRRAKTAKPGEFVFAIPIAKPPAPKPEKKIDELQAAGAALHETRGRVVQVMAALRSLDPTYQRATADGKINEAKQSIATVIGELTQAYDFISRDVTTNSGEIAAQVQMDKGDKAQTLMNIIFGAGIVMQLWNMLVTEPRRAKQQKAQFEKSIAIQTEHFEKQMRAMAEQSGETKEFRTPDIKQLLHFDEDYRPDKYKPFILNPTVTLLERLNGAVETLTSAIVESLSGGGKSVWLEQLRIGLVRMSQPGTLSERLQGLAPEVQTLIFALHRAGVRVAELDLNYFKGRGLYKAGMDNAMGVIRTKAKEIGLAGGTLYLSMPELLAFMEEALGKGEGEATMRALFEGMKEDITKDPRDGGYRLLAAVTPDKMERFRDLLRQVGADDVLGRRAAVLQLGDPSVAALVTSMRAKLTSDPAWKDVRVSDALLWKMVATAHFTREWHDDRVATVEGHHYAAARTALPDAATKILGNFQAWMRGQHRAQVDVTLPDAENDARMATAKAAANHWTDADFARYVDTQIRISVPHGAELPNPHLGIDPHVGRMVEAGGYGLAAGVPTHIPGGLDGRLPGGLDAKPMVDALRAQLRARTVAPRVP